MLTSIVEMYDKLATLLTARQKFSYLENNDHPLLKELVQFLSMFQETTLKLESWTTDSALSCLRKASTNGVAASTYGTRRD
jgi:hypothetical protein